MTDEWDAQEALKGLSLEQEMDDLDSNQMANKIFRENLVGAAASLCNIALYSKNEQTRMRAAQYVVERNLGQLKDVQPEAANDPFEGLIAEVVKDLDPDMLESMTAGPNNKGEGSGD